MTTNEELIAEARERAGYMALLADLTKNEPGAITAREEADRMTRFADALESLADRLAALTTPQEGDALEARQPSEDDREATEAEIDKSARALHMAKCCSLSGDSPHDFPEASEVFAAGVVLNAVARAAVPDAATGQWESKFLSMQVRAEMAEAERDAALEAIERVRAIAERHGVKPWTEEVFAALDGAPEPEVKP